MLAISTSWNVKKESDVKAMLAELKSTGLSTIEIGYHFKPEKLEQIILLLKPLGLTVSSVHNFCPCPDDEPSPRHLSNYYRLSALDERERRQAIEWTKRSVDTASRVGGGFVVVHAGTVEMVQMPYNLLTKMFEDGKSETEEFRQQRKKYLDIRRQKSPFHLDAVRKSLEEVLTYAQGRQVKIGLETRFYPNEIPNFEEVGYFLKLFAAGGLVYWHDTGHAQANDRLGITPHEEYLNCYRDHLAGVHIHDCQGLEDHLAPFTGEIDFKKVFALIPQEARRIIEVHWPATVDQIKTAVKRLTELEEVKRW